jgi:glycosyltransferase involved in cell wall biosynthesis
VTVVVLTFNEERNIEACLASVSEWAAAVVVVDSGSTDRTLDLARQHGAHVLVHPFESHARQWRWALNEIDRLGGAPAWTLGLDADQRLTPALRQAITEAVTGPAAPEVDGWFVNRRQIFRGHWIRHGGYYPKYLLKLFRRDRVALDPGDLVDHHFVVPGATRILSGDLIEDNRNEDDIEVWIAKHVRYAALQAQQEWRERTDDRGGRRPAKASSDPDARVRWQKRQWRRMPLFIRPAMYFTYRYFLRMGWRDGRQGFVFHFMQAFWYRLLVDVHLYRLGRDAAGTPEAGRELAQAAVDHEARS